MKDPHPYWMRILRQEQILRENARLRRVKYRHKPDISGLHTLVRESGQKR
jgi:hypothetical protein